MYFIKEMPLFERPREKLLKYGASHLSNAELLAILLRTGNSEKSVIELSKDVLYKLDEISDLKKITINNLTDIKGIKIAKAATIMAAIELGKRLDNITPNEHLVSSPLDVYMYMKELKHEEQENFYCLFLNSKLSIIGKELIYKGTVDKILIHPRDVFKEAVKRNSSYLILVHNHPTGNATPSIDDKKTTEELTKAAKLIDIEILDHVIIGNNSYYSFKEKEMFYL